MFKKLILLVIFKSVFSIYCHKCDSSQSDTCHYEYQHDHEDCVFDVVDCNKETGVGFVGPWNNHQCVKVIAEDKHGGQYIGRGCMPNTVDTCYGITKILKLFPNVKVEHVDCYKCDEHKCNSSSNVRKSYLIAAISIFIIFILI